MSEGFWNALGRLSGGTVLAGLLAAFVAVTLWTVLTGPSKKMEPLAWSENDPVAVDVDIVPATQPALEPVEVNLFGSAYLTQRVRSERGEPAPSPDAPPEDPPAMEEEPAPEPAPATEPPRVLVYLGYLDRPDGKRLALVRNSMEDRIQLLPAGETWEAFHVEEITRAHLLVRDAEDIVYALPRGQEVSGAPSPYEP